jgi:DNA uptake protein ComE-like DNA-binding protein
MKLSALKSFFIFNSSQRKGIILLVLCIVIVQIIFVVFNATNKKTPTENNSNSWLANQNEIDSLKNVKKEFANKIYPFNPNFITDFKGYKLGMSVAEIDRLLAFRKTNNYVNSAKEFQFVTKVSDSLLSKIAPYFKFPDWVNNKKNKTNEKKSMHKKQTKVVFIDINNATQADLIQIYGIGEALSNRILLEKEKLGGFVSMEQMAFVWGLSEEVIANLNKKFVVIVKPAIKKININSATIKELAQFPYFRYALAKAIVTERSMKGDFKNYEDLLKIRGFPADKSKIIDLYLEF